jgi:hypothetical protein
MSTTTTIYTSKDTWLDGENATTNNSGDDYLLLGQQSAGLGSGERANAVLAFDVSALNPSTLAQVNFKLSFKSSASGTTARSVYIYRLTRDFNESQANWNVSATGTNWTATDGGASDIATTQPSASFDVGKRTTSDASVDITDLVIDAIQKRSGTLYLWLGIPLSDTATATASGKYHSLEATTASDRPKLEVITASRVVWDGSAGDGNASTASNYVGDVAPDYYDHVIFNDGEVDVTSGNIICNSLFIGKGYKGTIEETDGTPINVLSVATVGHPTNNKVVINQNEGKFDLRFLTTSNWKLCIADCPTGGGRLYSTETGKYETVVSKTTGTLELDGDFDLSATGNKTGTKNIKTSGTVTSIKALNTKLEVSNGCNDFVLGDGTRMNATSGNIAQSGTSYITDKSYVDFQGLEISADVHIFSGTLSLRNNENATITTEDIMLWKKGLFDTRTNTGSWSVTASPSIDCRGGGKFLIDTGRTIAVTS